MKLEDNLMELPTGWNITNIGNLAEVIMGQSPPSDTYNYEKIGLPFFQGKAEFTDLHPTIKKWCREPNKIALPDDILVSVRAPVGAVNIANVECCIGRGLSAIRYPECNKFLFYFFKFIEKKLDERGTGTTFRAISGEVLKDFPLRLPPITEQHRIVAKIEALFSELDKGIESFKTAREQLKIYRQALLKHAFSGKLTAQWRAENADAAQGGANAARGQESEAAKMERAETLLQRIQTERQQRYQQQLKDWEANGKPGSKPKAPKTLPPLTAEELTELPELPKGWVYSRLGVLIDEPTYGTAKKCDYDTKGIGVLRIPNVVSGRIDSSDLKFAQFDDDEISAYKLDAGDILLIRSNGSVSIVGRCALVSEYDIGYLYAGYLIKLSPNKKLIVPSYLINQISAHSLRKQIETKAKSTSGVNNINSGEIQSLVVALCSIEEQCKILAELDSKLSIIDQLEQTINSSLQQAETLRQSILKKAFLGQLVPQDPNDEPASVLLERIRAEKANTDPAKTKRITNRKAIA